MKQNFNASLKHLNSFAIEVRASQLLELESDRDLQFLDKDFRFDPAKDLVLGGGSNILFSLICNLFQFNHQCDVIELLFTL